PEAGADRLVDGDGGCPLEGIHLRLRIGGKEDHAHVGILARRLLHFGEHIVARAGSRSRQHEAGGVGRLHQPGGGGPAGGVGPSGSCERWNWPIWRRNGLSRGTRNRSRCVACSLRPMSRFRSESGSTEGWITNRGTDSEAAKRASEKITAS